MSENDEYINSIKAVRKLHPAPHIFAAASEKVKDPNTEVHELEDVLKADVGLTTDIIKLSNSAHYGYDIECTNLGTAISRLGFAEVIKLVGISISSKLLNRNLVHYNMESKDFWSKSVSVAVLMEWLTVNTSHNQQSAYIIGLLHSVGLLVNNQIMDDFNLLETWDESIPVHEWERNLLGFDHAFAGATILKEWNFPEETCRPIAEQLRAPTNINDDFYHYILCFSHRILERTKMGFTNRKWNAKGLEKEISALKITDDYLLEIVESSRTSYNVAKEMLR